MKKLRKSNQKGFTLIELLVVVAIIGLLSSVVLISLNSARQKARDAKRMADVRQIASALEIYYNDCGSYPLTSAAAGLTLGNTFNLSSGAANANCNLAAVGTGATGGIATAAAAGTIYLGQFPSAPTPQDGACTVANNVYIYKSFLTGVTATVAGDTSAAGYTLVFCLGAQTGGYAAGVRTLSPAGIQ